MNYKTTLMKITAILRKWNPVSLLVLFSFLLLSTNHVQAQTLITDSDTPRLNVCSDYQQFTVKIAKASQACPNGKLKIELPDGFKLEHNSIKIDGSSASVISQTDKVGTVNIVIPAGPQTELLTITYNVKALCDIIGDNSEKVVNYTLTDCSGGKKTGTSEAINIEYAVLRINVSPASVTVNPGNEIERSITILNQGLGEISQFNLERILGNGLTHVSYDYSNLTALGWNISNNNGQLVFNGASGLKLKSGQSIVFKEKVKTALCGSQLTPTEYEVYYGCSEKCIKAGVNGTTSAEVKLNTSANIPQISVTAVKPNITCFNETATNEWIIKNEGAVDITDLEFEIGTTDPSGSVALQGGSPGTDPKKVKITIPLLKAGESQTIYFDQYYAAPNGTGGCENAPTTFTNNQNYYSAVYKYPNYCELGKSGAVVNGPVTYNYSGINLGEIDITSDYKVEYLFLNPSVIPSAGLNPGDRFEVIIELSPDLFKNGSSTLAGVIPVPDTNNPNKYKFIFEYDSPNWPINTDLNLTYQTLQFPIGVNCREDLDELWYKVGGELIKKKDENNVYCSSIVFKCNKTVLKAGSACPGNCINGLENRLTKVERISLGHAYDSNNAPIISGTVDPNDVNTRVFLKGDILEIYQHSDVIIDNTSSFSKVRLVIDKSSSIATSLVSGKGKVVVTRGGVEETFQNLTVNDNGTTYELDFDLAGTNTSLGTTFANGDKIRLSLQLKVIDFVGSPNDRPEFVQFPVASYLDQNLKCGESRTATGLFVNKNFTFNGGSTNFVDCENQTNSATFKTDFSTTSGYEFRNEYRGLFSPQTAKFEVPNTLTMEKVIISIEPALWLGANNSITKTVADLNNFDLSQALKDLTALTLGAGNGIDYINEDIVLKITPIVSLNACEIITETNQVIKVTLEGNIVDGDGAIHPETYTNDLTYNTGVRSLSLNTVNNNENGQLSADGKEVTWLIAVTSSGSRDFNSVWFANNKEGALVIKSVEKVDDQNGANPQTIAANSNDIYELDDFTSNTPKYYIIKADVIDCNIESLTLISGYNCNSNSYPSDINSGCGFTERKLTHKTIDNILQASIEEHSYGSAPNQHEFCNEFSYTVQLHNGGDSKLDNLELSIPLASTPGMTCTKVEIGDVYLATSDPKVPYTSSGVVFAEDPVTKTLKITLPNDRVLNTLERIRIKVTYGITSCDFKSGSKHTVMPSGKNTCGSLVKNVTQATTKRLIIKGGSDSFPELREKGTTTIHVDPVLTTGGVLRAVYNTEIINSGEFGVNDAITDDYKVALKLPDDWTVIGDPADYLLPLNKFEYEGIDPVRGYVYKIKAGQSIPVNQSIKFKDVPLKYTLNDQTTLTCDHVFGDIKVSVFQNIGVEDCPTSPLCKDKGIDQVLYEHTLPMELPLDGLLTITPEFQFPKVCTPSVNGGAPTLADIPFESATNVFHLDWYENELDAIADVPATRLPINTPLIDGRTYYVINRFIIDGSCKSSNIGKIKVTFKDNNLQGTVETICSVSNQTYQVKVTLSGTAPYVATGTGAPGTFASNVWTSDPIPASTPYGAGTPYEITFTDANECTPLIITGDAPMCCELEITCPQAVTITCGTSIDPSVTGIPTVLKSCGNTSYDYKDGVISACTNGVKTFTRTFTVTDVQGNKKTCTQQISIKDDKKPVFNEALPADLTVSCASEVPAAVSLTATDNCGNAKVTFNQTKVDGSCVNNFTLTRVWTATDECGNFVSHTQTITVQDEIAPSISTNAQNKTVQCSSTGYQTEFNAWLATNGGAIATDNCGTVTWSNNGATAAFLSTCGNAGSITVTFTATDACGNISTTTAIFTVEDTTKPIFTSDLPTDVTVSCAGDIPATEEATLTATDNCTDDADIEITVKDVKSNVSTICANNYTITRIYTAKDACGNTTTHTQIITVEDKTKPTFVEDLPQNITYECSSKVPTAPTLTADDNCGIATVTFKETKTAGSCESSFVLTRVWTATDECGNSISHKQTITVEDKVKPTFTVEPKNKVVECDGLGNLDGPDGFHAWLASNAGAEATDNCGSVTITHLIEDTNTICGGSGTIIVDFIAKDECGNITIKQATYAIFDRTPPTIADEDQPKDLEIECGKNIEDELNAWLSNNGGATATDSCGLITWKHNYAGKLSVCGAPIKVIFTATDSCGNFTKSNEVEVRLVDNIAPVLTKEAQSVTVQCGANAKQALESWLANHAGAEATDSCEIVTWSHDYDASKLPVACSANDTVTVIFTASDSCGNKVTTTATFKIEDTTAPTLVKAAQNKTVECDGNGNKAELDAWLAIHGGATATDTCDANLTWSNDYNNGANFASSCGSTGNVVVTFTATDACGNEVKTIATFTIVDTTKPIFTTKPQNEVVECDGSGNTSAYNTWLASFGNSVAEDICGTVTYSYAVIDTVVGCGKTSKTTVKFTATDACGNKVSEQATFEIVDTNGPEFITEAEDLVVECDGTGNNSDLTAWLNNRAGATAKDDCSTGLTWSHNFKGLTKACGNTGATEVTFTVIDACGNTNETKASFTIVDTTAPVFNVNLPQDRTIECSDSIPEVAFVTAEDLCSKATVSFKEERVDGNCVNNYKLVRTWIAADACGNTTQHEQIITVQDTTAPEFVGELPKAEIFIRCEDLKDAEVLKAVDNCGPAVVTTSDEVVPGECDTKYSILRTWVATDLCGNKTTFTQTINLSCQIEVFNAVTPNGDGMNDELVLNGIECYPGNTVEIFNRWGVLVYETKNYNSNNNTFKGFSEGRVTVNKDPKLPTGTYYYVIKYDYDLGNGQVYPIQQAGYLHLENSK